jgi:LemA protein
MSGGVLLSVLTIALLAWVVVTYNRFVLLRNRCANACSQIDVQLRRRHDLIPNLVAATRGYLEHERRVLEAVSAARRRVDEAGAALRQQPRDATALEALDRAELALSAPLGRLLALVEAYPALQGDESVRDLAEALTSTENRIAFARQAYNDQALVHNVAIGQFPASLVAVAFGFAPARLLRPLEPGQGEAVPVAI